MQVNLCWKTFNNYLHNHHALQFNVNSHDSIVLRREKRKTTKKKSEYK